MAVVIATGITYSQGAYSKSANLITGRNQFLGKGRIQLAILPSAIGMNASLSIGGVPLIDDLALAWFGTTGAMNVKDHIVVDQVVAGGTAEFYLRNTTVGALTNDYIVYFTPM